MELRFGVKEGRFTLSKGSDLHQCMSVALMLKYLGILLDNEKAEKEEFSIRLNIQEAGKEPTSYVATVHSGVLLTYIEEDADIKEYATFTKDSLFALLAKKLDVVKDKIETNSYETLKKLEGYLVDLSEYRNFPVIEPVTKE